MMRALQISLCTVDKMSFLTDLGSYCIVESRAICGEYSLERSVQDLYQGGYLKSPLDLSSLIIDVIVGDKNNGYVGINISSIDILRALILTIQDFDYVFFQKSDENISFFQKMIKNSFGVNDNVISSLFWLNAPRINESSNSFQVWNYFTVFLEEPPYGLPMIITGTDYQLENISNLFKRNFNHIGECIYFFGNDELINLEINS